MKDKVSAVIVDDHEIAQLGLSVALETISYIEIAGCFFNSKELFKFLKKQEPDIIFMDSKLRKIVIAHLKKRKDSISKRKNELI